MSSGPQQSDLPAVSTSMPVPDLPETVRSLEARLNRTEEQIKKLTKSDENWLKKAGLVLGVLGGLIATPKAIKENVVQLFSRANTTVTWGRPLNVRFDPHDRVLRLDFPVLANNEGNRNDIVDTVAANLHSGHPITDFQVSDSDIEITEDGRQVLQPFPIELQKPRSLVFAFSLASPFSEKALGFEGQRSLIITMTTQGGRRLSYKYCFDFDNIQAQEVMSGRELHIRFATCD